MSQGRGDYQFGPFRISGGERVLRRDGQVVPLTPKCVDTLLVLAEHGGRVVEKEALIRAVWPDTFVEDGNLSQNIFTLRKTLGEAPGGGRYIQTIPKRGYCLVIPAVEGAAPRVESAAAPAVSVPAPRRSSYMAAAALLVACLAIAARWVWPHGDPGLTGVRTTRLIVPNQILYGVISPDGKQIAYVSEEGSGQSLWVRDTGGVGSGLRVTGPLAGHFWGVSYSPDRAFLYFTVEDETQSPEATLFRIPSGGGNAEKLISGVGAAPAFTPDGRRIVFKRYDENDRGYLLTAGALGTDAKIVAQSTASYAFHNYQWSADGKNIYYVEGTRVAGGSLWSLWELPAAGGPAQLVMAPQARPLRSVNWLSRSEILALIPDDDSGGSQIWRVGTGGEARRITNDIVNYSQITLTSDGRTLLANSLETEDSIWTAAPPGMAKDEPVRLRLPAGSYNHPVWTPDGHVVFVGQSNLWLASADGANRRPLLPEKTTAMEPAVSPDGQFVIFVLHQKGIQNLWRIGVRGEGLRQLTTGRFDWHPAISADGKWVAYASYSQGLRALRKQPLEGSAPPVKLVNAGGANLAISPDGRLFAVSNDFGETEIRSFDDGHLIRKLTAPAGGAQFHWSPDGKMLTFVASAEKPPEFWTVAVAGGAPERIGAPLPRDLVDLEWSHDGGRIVYLRREIKVDLALMHTY